MTTRFSTKRLAGERPAGPNGLPALHDSDSRDTFHGDRESMREWLWESLLSDLSKLASAAIRFSLAISFTDTLFRRVEASVSPFSLDSSYLNTVVRTITVRDVIARLICVQLLFGSAA